MAAQHKQSSNTAAQKTQLKYFPRKNGRCHMLWSPEMLRAAIDIVDANKPIRGTLDHIAEQVSQAITKLPEDRRNNLSLSDIKNKMKWFSKSMLDNRSTADFLLYGGDVLNFASLPEGVLSETELKTWNEQRAAKTQTKKPGDEKSPREHRNRPVSDSKDKVLEGDVAQLQRNLDIEAQTSFIKDAAPAAVVRKEMNSIYQNICRCVADRLGESGVSPDEPVLDLLLPRSPKWRELLEVMTGCEGPNFDPGLETIRNMQATQRLPLDNFMVSTIGAATTAWALNPCPFGYLLGVGYQVLLTKVQTLHHAGALVLEEEARNQLLQDEVIPAIPDKAAALARDVDEILSVFAAPPRGGPAAKARRAFRVATDSVNPRKKVKFDESPWVKDWRQELKCIFEKALRLRVDLEKKCGQYRFSFPTPGADWEAEDKRSYILMGFFPALEGRFQTVRGGEWGEWEDFADAQVDAVNMDGRSRTPNDDRKLRGEGATRVSQAEEVDDSEHLSEIEASESPNGEDKNDATYTPKTKHPAKPR